jgi:hypothetical protein
MGRPRRLTDLERKASGAERQRRYKARHGWVARERQKQSMRALRAKRKEALGVTTAQVNNRKPFHDDGLLPLGELHYGPVAGVDTPMEPKPFGGRGRASQVSHGVAWDERERTPEEERVAEQLEAFKARRRGVQVELIL